MWKNNYITKVNNDGKKHVSYSTELSEIIFIGKEEEKNYEIQLEILETFIDLYKC